MSAEDAVAGADALLVLTPWPAFRDVDLFGDARADDNRSLRRAAAARRLLPLQVVPRRPRASHATDAAARGRDRRDRFCRPETSMKRSAGSEFETLPLGRREIDLLAPDAVDKLREILKPEDSVVLVSARGRARNVPMLMENLRMADAVCAALAERPVAHLLYISSDAVYADDANPVSKSSHAAPSTIHGMMHATREMMLRNATKAPVAMLRPTSDLRVGRPAWRLRPQPFPPRGRSGRPDPHLRRRRRAARPHRDRGRGRACFTHPPPPEPWRAQRGHRRRHLVR